MSRLTSGNVLISPRMDSQTKDRSALYKRRNESPKFRDVLRERCRSRIKASRRALLDEFRQKSGVDGSDGIREVLSSMLIEEIKILKEGAPEIREEQNAFHEFSDNNEEQWLLSEYEKVLEEQESMFSREWENEVICPLCERSLLVETMDDLIFCRKCNEYFPNGTQLQILKDVLDKSIKNHSLSCDEKPQFALISENESNGLYQICDICGLFIHL